MIEYLLSPDKLVGTTLRLPELAYDADGHVQQDAEIRVLRYDRQNQLFAFKVLNPLPAFAHEKALVWEIDFSCLLNMGAVILDAAAPNHEAVAAATC